MTNEGLYFEQHTQQSTEQTQINRCFEYINLVHEIKGVFQNTRLSTKFIYFTRQINSQKNTTLNDTQSQCIKKKVVRPQRVTRCLLDMHALVYNNVPNLNVFTSI